MSPTGVFKLQMTNIILHNNFCQIKSVGERERASTGITHSKCYEPIQSVLAGEKVVETCAKHLLAKMLCIVEIVKRPKALHHHS